MDHRQDYRHPFLDCFTHAGGRKLAQSPELKRNILAVLIAMATNLGLARMSDACGISYDVLAWTMEYLREETLREAKTAVVNHHYGLELSKVFGGGTMSSSDGQRFPVRGTSLSGRDMIIHRGRVLSTYTHVSDQWPTYGTTIIVPTAREAHFALDEFLGNATDLPITDHATDTVMSSMQDSRTVSRPLSCGVTAISRRWASPRWPSTYHRPRSPAPGGASAFQCGVPDRRPAVATEVLDPRIRPRSRDITLQVLTSAARQAAIARTARLGAPGDRLPVACAEMAGSRHYGSRRAS